MTEEGLKFDNDKLRFDLLHPEFEEGVAKILTMGAEKYSPNNWVHVSDPEDRYYAALRRHISAYRKGETRDAESGESHLYHAACCLMFLSYFEKVKKLEPNTKNQPTQG